MEICVRHISFMARCRNSLKERGNQLFIPFSALTQSTGRGVTTYLNNMHAYVWNNYTFGNICTIIILSLSGVCIQTQLQHLKGSFLVRARSLCCRIEELCSFMIFTTGLKKSPEPPMWRPRLQSLLTQEFQLSCSIQISFSQRCNSYA